MEHVCFLCIDPCWFVCHSSFLDDDVKRSRIPSLLNDLPVSLLVTSPEVYLDCFGSIDLLPPLLIVDSMCHYVFQNLKSDRTSVSLNEGQRRFVENSLFAMHVLMIPFTFRCTSGSTETHSGIIFQSSEGMLSRLNWMSSLLHDSLKEVEFISCFSGTGFIDSVTILLDSIVNHRCLLIPNHTILYRPSILSSLLSTSRIHLLRITPSLLLTICINHSVIHSAIQIHLSGELLTSAVYKRLQNSLPNAHFYNVYGGGLDSLSSYVASETSGDCFSFNCDLFHNEDSVVPIGTPLPGCQYHITQQELIIEGSFLCYGEWNQKRMCCFHSGDIAKEITLFQPTGDKGIAMQQVLVTSRRMDNDIMKVHGVRYSKNMIRSLFLQCPMINDIWLTSDQNQLIVILLTDSSACDDVLKQVRCEMRERFPWFVVPWTGTLIHSVPHLSGKLTNQVIIAAVKSSQDMDKERSSTSNEYPMTRSLSQSQTTAQLTELTIQRLMSEIVGCELQANDDFYNAGGDSLRTLILLERLHEIGIPHSLQPRDIFTHSTPVSLYTFLSSKDTSNTIRPHSFPSPIPCHSFHHSITLVSEIPFLRCVDCDPIAITNNVFCCCCHGGLLKLCELQSDKVTTLLETQLHERVEKSLTLHNDSLIIGTYQGSLFFLNRYNGSIQSHISLGGECRSPMGVCENVGAICAYNGYLYVMNLDSQRLISLLFLNGNCHATPLVMKDTNIQAYWIVCVTIRGDLIILRYSQESLQIRLRKRLSHPVFADPIWIGNNLLILDVEGELLEVTLNGEIVGSLSLHSYLKKGGLCHLAPVIRNSIGFISCSSGEIVKVDVLTKQVLGTVALDDSGCTSW